MENQFPKDLTLILRARHFKDTDYRDGSNDAISKAAAEFFGEKYICSNSLEELIVMSTRKRIVTIYYHDYYSFDEDERMRGIADFNHFDDTVIVEYKMKRRHHVQEVFDEL